MGDLEDARNAIEISNPSLNIVLLKKIVAVYGRDELAKVEKLLREVLS